MFGKGCSVPSSGIWLAVEMMRDLLKDATDRLKRSWRADDSSLTRAASSSFAAKLVGAVVGFGAHIALARLLGAHAYGSYVYVLTWLNVLVLLGLWGSNTAIMRFVPEYRATQRWGLLRGFLHRSAQGVLVASVIIALTGAIVLELLFHAIPEPLRLTFLVGMAALPFLAFIKLTAGGLRAVKRAAPALSIETIIRPLLLVTAAAALYWFLDGRLSSALTMGLFLTATALSAIVGLRWLIRELPHEIWNVTPAFETANWFRTAAPMFMMAGMYMILNRTDVLMIGALLHSTQAGIYAAAMRIATLGTFGLTAINVVAAPLISELYSTKQLGELQRVLKKAAAGVFVVTTVSCIPLAALGRPILSLFGPNFAVAYAPLLVLLGGHVFNALSGSVGFLMSMTGHQVQAARIIAVSAVLNIILNWILVPRFHLLGAAVATVITMLLWNVVMLIWVVTKLKINPTIFPFRPSAAGVGSD